MRRHKMHDHTNHMWTMALACGSALLLFFALPFFGISRNWTTGIALAAMIVLHVWMMRGHAHKHSIKKGAHTK